MSRLHLCRSGHFVAASCRGPYELPFNVRHATTTVEYRAAAYLRAQSFYSESYPPDRSEFARRAHLRMKADEMWRELEEKCNQDEEIRSLGSIDVLPLITAATETSMPGIAASFEDPSVALPTESEPQYVIGTLDINIGAVLPSEELIGKLPAIETSGRTNTGPSKARAYLSNVCVLSSCRRMGVASAMVTQACQVAASKGVRHLYVHVVASNEPALRLYENQCGFEIEQREDESFARALNRPRRLLLHREL